MCITGLRCPKKARYEETVHYFTTGTSWNVHSWVSQVQVLTKLLCKLFKYWYSVYTYVPLLMYIYFIDLSTAS
mgnify:CR=1 FL=1